MLSESKITRDIGIHFSLISKRHKDDFVPFESVKSTVQAVDIR